MKRTRLDMRLFVAGAGRRLAGAAAIAVVLWLGFFWATGAFGAP